MSGDNTTMMLLNRISELQLKQPETLDTLRTTAAKLHARAASTDKRTRDKTLEAILGCQYKGLEMLMTLLENCRDPLLGCSIAGTLHECVRMIKTKKGKPKDVDGRRGATHHLVTTGAPAILVRLIIGLGCGAQGKVPLSPAQVNNNELLLHELLWLLAQISHKDGKFSLKTRTMGALRPLHVLLRFYYSHLRLQFPLLIIFKSLVKNTPTCASLNRDGFAQTMERVMVSLGTAPTPKLRVTIQIIAQITKHKQSCIQVLKTAILHWLLRCLDRAHRNEGKAKAKIMSSGVTCLLQLCELRAGRCFLSSAAPIQTLVRLCHNLPEGRFFDGLMAKICNLIHLLVGRTPLPITNLIGPIPFPLPCEEELENKSREGSPASDDLGSEHGSDSDGGATDDADPEAEGIKEIFGDQRPLEDLVKYVPFFREYGSLERQLEINPWLSRDVTANCQSYLCGTLGLTVTTHSRSMERKQSDPFSYTNNSSREFNAWSKNEKDCILKRYSESGFDLKTDGPKMKYLRDIPFSSSPKHAYIAIASQVRSVIPFVKVSHPEAYGHRSSSQQFLLQHLKKSPYREKIMGCIERSLNPQRCMNTVVYDLDELVSKNKKQENNSVRTLSNEDEKRLGKHGMQSTLQFESRFESGNLRKVVQTSALEYDLILTPDVNSDKRYMWFYFEVSNMIADTSYTFNICNCEKANSQFNYGMKPVIYSVQEAVLGRIGWERGGTSVCYYRNNYQNPHTKANALNGSYYTATFNIVFPHHYDVVYIAYHYPYSYSRLLTDIWKLQRSLTNDIIFRVEPLCNTLNENEPPVLTITALDNSTNKIENRSTIFLTSRVHPGESNASWVMKGTLSALLGPSLAAQKARRKYVFKVIPMLNVEGVINGCYRCGLTDEDLNRRWGDPHPVLHPEIFHAKGLMEYVVGIMGITPELFCDYHGHSRRKNVFLYGCCPQDSWRPQDKECGFSNDFMALPLLMASSSGAFSLSFCSYRVERKKESTARVAVWRQLGVQKSYTLEASFCGCDQGELDGYHLDTRILESVGKGMVDSIADLDSNVFMLHAPEINKPKSEVVVLEDRCLSDISESDSEDFEL